MRLLCFGNTTEPAQCGADTHLDHVISFSSSAVSPCYSWCGQGPPGQARPGWASCRLNWSRAWGRTKGEQCLWQDIDQSQTSGSQAQQCLARTPYLCARSRKGRWPSPWWRLQTSEASMLFCLPGLCEPAWRQRYNQYIIFKTVKVTWQSCTNITYPMQSNTLTFLR